MSFFVQPANNCCKVYVLAMPPKEAIRLPKVLLIMSPAIVLMASVICRADLLLELILSHDSRLE